jgi:2-polyprenylphenol 6-hydroxylase
VTEYALAHECDVVIIGGGMVGATLAALLGDSVLRVAVVEPAPPQCDWPEDSVDLRVSALTAASQRILDAVGAWPAMVALGVSPFREMRVWDASGNGEIHFDCADIGEPRLGHIVENRVIQRVLFERLRSLANVRMFCPAALESLAVGAGAEARLADGTVIRARLVVAADGANSRTRTLAGIRVRGWSYDQKAVVATVATESSHQATAWQRFLPDGPLAFLPLRDGRSSIVWSTRPEHAEHLLAAEAGDFMNELAEAFAHRLGRITGCGPRAAFPLRLQYADNYIGARIALVGDAAHAIHPLAGQGVNLGMLDAAALAEVLRDAVAQGRDIGATPVLRRYERWRKGDNLTMMLIMDGFKRLFGATAPPLRLARNLGLTLTDNAVPVKNLIIRHAMGLKGDLPQIARQPCL